MPVGVKPCAGVVAVLAIASLTACGGRVSTTTGVARATTEPAQTVAAAPVHYRLLHAPVALIEKTSSGPAFQVRVRMNRRLPTDAQGVRINVLVGTSGSDAPPVAVGDRSRHCYAASIGNDVHGGDPSLEDAHRGTVVRVSIRIPGQRTLVRRVALRSRSEGVSVFGALGCVARSASRRTCGFRPANFHTILERKNLTCAEAKRVLLRLRGRRDTIPMICGRSRIIQGWRLESGSRFWSAVVNRYSRGRQSFVYLRDQNAYRVYCPPKGGFTSEGV